MSVERAMADLERLDDEAQQLKKRIAEIDKAADRLRVYVAVAQEYSGHRASTPEAHLIFRSTLKGITGAAVEACIALLKEEGAPIHTRVLLSRLAAQNIVVGGGNPVANLSGFLSREKSRLRNSRTDGWSLREWDNRPIANAGPLERTELADHGEDSRDGGLDEDSHTTIESEARVRTLEDA